eukprot:CAMPEP_0116012774 /NCGR_PEP_ID=MMETSP0321-20121206/5322_1 /TAXON_ID=163516 /ORGANISM="Leptocylindrus danicus var. danicus, Strain B650" /LENGTH=111 /DNA_ID=CAMNT_0003482179 /DNA_START=164 /DNA_END=499 /DNA_ORIENTATION=-
MAGAASVYGVPPFMYAPHPAAMMYSPYHMMPVAHVPVPVYPAPHPMHMMPMTANMYQQQHHAPMYGNNGRNEYDNDVTPLPPTYPRRSPRSSPRTTREEDRAFNPSDSESE